MSLNETVEARWFIFDRPPLATIINNITTPLLQIWNYKKFLVLNWQYRKLKITKRKTEFDENRKKSWKWKRTKKFWKIGNSTVIILGAYKVGCVFPMVISSEFRKGQYTDDDHREDASHFIGGYGVYPIIKQKVRERDLSRDRICMKTLL